MSARFNPKVRLTVLSYLQGYPSREAETVFVHRRGLRMARWSYKRLAHTANKVARELAARGVARGERVLLTGQNSPEWVAAFWGCLLRGAVVVPLDRESPADFVSSVRRQTDARLTITDADTAAACADVPKLRLEELNEIVAHHSAQPYSVENIDEETIAEIIFTSGTTHAPKGVVLTHGNLLANLRPIEAEIQKYIRWERFFHPVCFLNLVPLSHVFGQFMGVFVPQLLGGEVHFQESLNPAQLVRSTQAGRVSVVVLVPRILDALREWVERDYAARGRTEELRAQLAAADGASAVRRWLTFRRVHRLFGWKFWAFISGGATLDERTEQFWRRLGFAVLQGYGMTETASLITVTHPFKRRGGSIGKLMPGYEVKFDDTGEIMVRGASVSPGYWSAEGRLDARAGEWLRTGDVGEMDAAGNIYFKGRKKDTIVTAAGLNIHPEDLEAALNRQPEVRASCVVAIEGARGPEPLAVLLLRERSVSAEAAIKRANLDLAEHQQLRRWAVWAEPDFPRTATHKIIRREVAATVLGRLKADSGREYKTGPLRADGHSVAARPSSFIADEAARISDGDVPPAALKPSAALATDLRLDSLGRVELMSALEDRYGIELDEAAFTAATTVGDVEKIVCGEIEVTAAPYPYPKWTRKFPLTWVRALLFYVVILPITKMMSRLRIVGRANLDELTEPALFIANHVTLADHALILAALPARQRHRLAIAMEGERLRGWFHPPAGSSLFVRLRLLAQYALVTTFFHVFPLPKLSGFRRSFAYAGACVDRGESVLVFPEGARAPRGQMQMSRFKIGVGLLTKELNVKVVPVRLHGLYELKRRGQYFADPGVVKVVFGAPIKFEADASPAAIAEELERRVAAL